MKRLIIIICLILFATCAFGQRRCLITDINYSNIVYDLYDGSTVVATNQLFIIADHNMTNAQLSTALKAQADNLYNFDYTSYFNIHINIGDNWEIVVDSVAITGTNLNMYYRVLDDTAGIVNATIFNLLNTQTYNRPLLKMFLQQKAIKIKNAEIFVRSKSDFIGTFIQ